LTVCGNNLNYNASVLTSDNALLKVGISTGPCECGAKSWKTRWRATLSNV